MSSNLHPPVNRGRNQETLVQTRAGSSSVRSLSRARRSATPWTAARQASLSVADSRAGLERKKWPSWVPLFHTRPRHPVPTALAREPDLSAGSRGGRRSQPEPSLPAQRSEGRAMSTWLLHKGRV